MSKELYFLIMTLLCGVVTIALRAFPFVMFSGSRPVPPVIKYIGKVLAPAAIAMLVIYCYASSYRDTSFAAGGYGIPEAAASVAVILLQLWKRNPLLSIIVGTAIYMVLKQTVF